MTESPVTWESRKQKTTALSSTEVEYMAMSEASKEDVYLQGLFTKLGVKGIEKVRLFSDSCGAIKLVKNPVFHNRSKHIDVRHHFVRGILESNHIEIVHKLEDIAMDILTKGLSGPNHRKCIEFLGLRTWDQVK